MYLVPMDIYLVPVYMDGDSPPQRYNTRRSDSLPISRMAKSFPKRRCIRGIDSTLQLIITLTYLLYPRYVGTYLRFPINRLPLTPGPFDDDDDDDDDTIRHLTSDMLISCSD